MMTNPNPNTAKLSSAENFDQTIDSAIKELDSFVLSLGEVKSFKQAAAITIFEENLIKEVAEKYPAISKDKIRKLLN